jgi:hypothetical protein
VVQIGAENNLGVPVEHLPKIYRFNVEPPYVTTEVGS